MWAKFVKQQGFERQELRRLLTAQPQLLAKERTSMPDSVEVWALAALLHSFYSGIENIFKRLAQEVDAQTPQGDNWHRDLLNQMAQSTPQRPAAISPTLRVRLGDYLAFRHFFRSNYTYKLAWPRMSQLALDCEATLAQLETELDTFLHRAQPDPPESDQTKRTDS